MDAHASEGFRYTNVDDLIMSRQAALMKQVLQAVGGLTVVAILLILFLPGFATTDGVLEPFLRNMTIVVAIAAIYRALDRGYVIQSFVAVILVALIACPYSVYMEAPRNLPMLFVMFVPIGLGGFLPRRTQFWAVYLITMVVTFATLWAIVTFRDAQIAYPSMVTVWLLMTILALMTDGLSSSYRQSIRSTFDQLQQIRDAHDALGTLTADRDRALNEKREAESLSDRRARSERLALDAAGAGILDVDLTTLAVQVSQDFLYRSGLGDTLRTVEDLARLMTSESEIDFRAAMQRIRAGEVHNINGDFRLQREDGEPLIWFVAADVVRDPVNNRAGLYGVVIDATDRVMAEDERRALNERMTETQRLESLGVLAGGIAHDFNNLLHVIMLNAEISREGADAKSASAIDKLLLSAGRASELCSQLLAYSGRGNFVVERVDLTSLVHEMGHLLEVSTLPGTEIRYESDGSEAVIKGDITQIRQIVMNLITNASDAIGTEPGTITIATGLVEYRGDTNLIDLLDDIPPGTYARISVADTGGGIDMDFMSRIFEPFVTTKASGRGLGLSAVLGIVRAHAGGIAIHSSPDTGTRIDVLLPHTADTVETRVPDEPEPEPIEYSGKILFADDEVEIRNLARIVLGDCGFDVIEANDGLEAERLFRLHRESLRLVILDVMMPGKTGVEVFSSIAGEASDIPVILSSGFSESDALEPVRDHGVTFLKKPYLTRTLREAVISSIMQGSKAPDASS